MIKFTSLLIVCSFFGALASCAQSPQTAQKDQTSAQVNSKGGAPKGKGTEGANRTPFVTLGQVKMHEFIEKIEAVGTANAAEAVTITANVTERIKSLAFQDGQFVRRGQILVVLSSSEEVADFDQSRARLAESQAQLERVQKLAEQGYATAARLDTAMMSRNAARAEVAVREARIADRVIRAPFSGTVGLRRVSPGLVVSAGTPILTLTDVSRIKLDFTIPETQIAQVRIGQEVQAKAAAYGERNFIGRIEGIDPQIDPVTRSASVRAVVPNPDGALKAGMLLSVSVIQSKRTALAVPEQSLVALREERAVFEVEPDTLEVSRRVVKIGTREPGFVEILAGIPEGTTIVVDGTVKVRDGGKVRTIDRQRQQPKQQSSGSAGGPLAEGEKTSTKTALRNNAQMGQP